MPRFNKLHQVSISRRVILGSLIAPIFIYHLIAYMAPHSLLKQLHDRTERWSVIVRVFRRWNVYQKNSPSDLFCITMILVDEEGTKIQASVIPRNLHQRFQQSMIEGNTYFIANFLVSQNASQYRATNHQFKINFTQHTFVKHQQAAIPLSPYTFYPITEVLKSQQRNFTDYLIDVIAFVRSIGALEEYRRDNETKNKLRMVLTDIENNDLECVLFDECSTNAYMSHLENMETPVVVVLNLVRIAFSEEGRPQVCSSFNATRVYFNPAIPEVQQLIQSASDNDSFATPNISQLMPHQLSQQSNSTLIRNNNKILISHIADQQIGQPFVINCELTKLETRHGWVYDACGKCSSKLKEADEVLICPGCKKKPDSIDSKIKVHYTIADESGEASVIFWDKLGVELLGKSATELKLILKEKDRQYDFPDECDSVVGKNLMIKLKLNEFNLKHPGSSISVLQFTVCEDLANEFNTVVQKDEADPEIMENDVTSDNASNAIGTMTPIPQTTIKDSPDSSNNALSQTSKHVPPPTAKGKRRCYLKRNVNITETSTQEHQSPPILTASDEPLIKMVKQEK